MDATERIPPPWVVRGRPEVGLARIGLGFTLYLSDARSWGREGAAEALRCFERFAAPQVVRWVTTSALTAWRDTSRGGLDEWARALRSTDRPRHLLTFKAVDSPILPATSFTYREVDDARGERRGFIQVLLPGNIGADALLHLATGLTGCGPWLCGVGGYAVGWNDVLKASAFFPIHGWCKRYLALDVQDAESMSWRVTKGLPGASWLTLIGEPCARALEIDLPALLRRRWRHVVPRSILGGLLLQAGGEPSLGDLNRLAYPEGYAEVWGRIAPKVVDPPPPLWGKFWEQGDSRAWFRRFLEPDAWA